LVKTPIQDYRFRTSPYFMLDVDGVNADDNLLIHGRKCFKLKIYSVQYATLPLKRYWFPNVQMGGLTPMFDHSIKARWEIPAASSNYAALSRVLLLIFTPSITNLSQQNKTTQ